MANNFYDDAFIFWGEKMQELESRPWPRRLAAGELGVAHYKGFLLETYHNTAFNPQLQAYASMFLRNNPREVIKKFYQHAISEIGHDLLALNDLKVLGVDEELVKASRPLPTTAAFFANTVFQIQFNDPSAYLSYLFHLEVSPTQNGEKIMSLLRAKGVPENALTFIDEHAKVDVSHLKLMRIYLEEVVVARGKEKVFLESLEDCIVLHNRVLEAAFENGEKRFSK